MSIDPHNLSATAHPTFNDDFNTLSLWNGSSGAWSTSFWYQGANSNGASLTGNGEQEWYINSQYGPTSGVQPWTANNGVATLTATPTPAGLSGEVNNYSYISGELNTYHSFSQTYGYFEMRAQLPKGQGFWPAFWLMPENGAWPPELDAMEVLGSDPTTLVTSAHSGAQGHTSKGQANAVEDTSAGYHTYGVDWEPDTITWYFDGREVFHTPTPSDMNTPMYMIANLAVGGYWPGSADGVSSAQMNIDYIRAYAPGAAPTGDQPAAAPPSAAQAGQGQAPSVDSPTDVAAPHASAPATGGVAYVNDQQYWAGDASTIVLTGWRQAVHMNDAGATLYSSQNANTIHGGGGDDTIFLGRGGDTVTGGGGHNDFVFGETPWAAADIADFTQGPDRVDVRGLLARSDFTGGDPFAAGYLKYGADAHGDAQIWSDLNQSGNSGWWLVATLDGVDPSSLHYSNGMIT